MKIQPRNIPKFLNPSGPIYAPSDIKRGILKSIGGNNIYFKDDFSKYHDWHGRNIVLKGYQNIQNPNDIDFETYFRKAMESWNDAGGFDWLYGNDGLRKGRLLSDGTYRHQDLTQSDYPWLNDVMRSGDNGSMYVDPSNPLTKDRFSEGKVGGFDNDFGLLTGNRRPTIHRQVSEDVFNAWADYFKKLGYKGAYLFLDHWIPTKDESRIQHKFEGVEETQTTEEPATFAEESAVQVETPEDEKVSSAVKRSVGNIPTAPYNGNGLNWDKIRTALSKLFPNILEAGRLAGSLATNANIYKTQLAGIRPNLLQPYLTHRQVVGDEAGKQLYYRRAALGEWKASRPATSDMDRQIAYLMEARRAGNELRALGDLVDNQEIRKTSDESNQHQWSNTQRRTEAANYNTAQINQANAARQQLAAQKLAADWTSKNNYLLGLSTRARTAQDELKALEDLLWMLNKQYEYQNDPLLRTARTAYNNAYQAAVKRHTDAAGNIDYTGLDNDQEYLDAKQEYQNLQYEFLKKLYQDQIKRRNWNPLFVKEGGSLSYKKKDDLLYKAARDAVEHFRKMSKITSDANLKSRSKPINLSSHPSGKKTRKMQQGGLAPFVVYTPATSGAEVSRSSSGSAKGKEKQENNPIDIIKSLFSLLEGLPADVNGLYAQMQHFLSNNLMFGNEISTTDLATMYLLLMQLINNVKFSKAAYDLAKTQVTNNDGLNEYAVNAAGQVAVQDKKNGGVKFTSWETAKKSENLIPLTNANLLQLRAYSPNMKFNNELLDVVSNGVGVSKIADYIKTHLPSMESTEQTIEGYTKKDSEMIAAGVQLLKNAPEGTYKFTQYTKTQQQLMLMAYDYILRMLPTNMRAILSIHADRNGSNLLTLLQEIVQSGTGSNNKLEFSAVTGKASQSGVTDGKITPAVALALGMGEREDFVIADKTSDGLRVKAVSMPLLDANHNPMASSTLLQVGNGDYSGQLRLESATMGNVKLAENGMNTVLINSRIYAAELPIDTAAAARGIIRPNLDFLRNIETADKQIAAKGITNRDNLTPLQIDTINEIYRLNGLPMIYSKDSSGHAQLTDQYRRFALLKGTAPADAFEGDLTFNDGAQQLSKDELNLYNSMMQSVTNDKKYKVDGGWFGTNVYTGTIYIPMSESVMSALGSTGYSASPEDFMTIDNLDLLAKYIRDHGLQILGSVSK